MRKVNRKRILFVALLLAMMLTLSAQTISALTVIEALPITNPDRITIPTLPVLYQSGHGTIKAVPIYRAYHGGERYGIHHYTVSKAVYDAWMLMSGYASDGLAGYISPVPLPYGVPVWLMDLKGESYFALGEADRDAVIGKYGYENRGILGYAVPLNDTNHGDSVMNSWYKGDVDNTTWWEPLDVWNADHYYHNQVYYIGNPYTYEGPKFRAWSSAATLQEIKVTYPNGGETLTGGSTVNIKWNTVATGGKVNLYYTLNPNDGWAKIADNLDNTGTYAWKVPNSATKNAIVEARWTYSGIDANCYDQSDKYVTIQAGAGTTINWLVSIKPIKMELLLPPAAPTGFTVVTYEMQKQPYLIWEDRSSNETAFVIERRTEGGAYSQLAKTNPDQNFYVDNQAAKGIVYYYRVKAINGQLSSAYCNEGAARVYEEPPVEQPPSVSGEVAMQFALNQNTYTVNGESKTMDASPISLNGRTTMPVRFVADPLGADTAWDPVEQKVTVTLGSTKLELWIGNNIALINGVETPIDPDNPNVKPIILNSRTMLPLRFVTEKLGCTVEWIPEGSLIRILYSAN